MKETGILLWLGGIATAGYAMLLFDVSYGSTVNLDLQQQQMMIFLGALVAILCGVGLQAMSYLMDELVKLTNREIKTENADPLS